MSFQASSVRHSRTQKTEYESGREMGFEGRTRGIDEDNGRGSSPSEHKKHKKGMLKTVSGSLRLFYLEETANEKVQDIILFTSFVK
jgi:hypothetical protein